MRARLKRWRDKNRDYYLGYLKKYRNSPSGWANKTWNYINRRTINGAHPYWTNAFHRFYLTQLMGDGTVGVQLQFSREEFTDWTQAHWPEISLMMSQATKIRDKPTIDRIDSSKHYSLDNIMISTYHDNCLKSAINTNKKNKARKLEKLLPDKSNLLSTIPV